MHSAMGADIFHFLLILIAPRPRRKERGLRAGVVQSSLSSSSILPHEFVNTSHVNVGRAESGNFAPTL